VIGQGVWILWWVENCHLPLTKPVAVNTTHVCLAELAHVPRSEPWQQFIIIIIIIDKTDAVDQNVGVAA